MGRLFTDSECGEPGAGPVVLLGEEIWRNRFDSDPGIMGKTVRINRTPFTVAGILPAGFAGRIRGEGIWIPWTMEPSFLKSDLFQADSVPWLTAEGRLKPGRSRQEAQSELAVIAARQDQLDPGRRTTMYVTNGSFGEEPSLRASLFWMGPTVMGALALILLIACTNVTVLQLSRATTRQREMAIRLAIGAGRARLTRMLLTEMLLLATVAGVLSAYISFAAPALLIKALMPSGMPVYQTHPDLPVLIYLGAAILLATMIAGMSPAAESLRVDLHGAMKPGATGLGSGANKRRNLLVASQVAMSLVLLLCAGLFVRAQHTMFTADPGFETRRVFSVSVQPGLAAATVQRLHAVPGVRSVAAGSPMSSEDEGPGTQEVRTPGQAAGAGKQAAVTLVSTDYFDTLRIPLLEGRPPGNATEAVVSRRFAAAFWSGGNPVGGHVILDDGTAVAIVGVARDVESEHPGLPDGPHLYRWQGLDSASSLLVAFHGDAAATASLVGEAIRSLDPESQAAPRTLRAILDELAERFSTMVRMAGVLAALALSLAVLGMYGVVSFSVSRRTKEVGIRMALGATQARVVWLVLRSGARPIAWGIGAGVVQGLVSAQAVAAALRHSPVAVRAGDPLTIGAVALLLASVALAAMFRPAWRAAAADPMKALRDE